MSSNKTASQLVNLLNDLFGRFDKLCTESGCEKISTLGDCYYSVSGNNGSLLCINRQGTFPAKNKTSELSNNILIDLYLL